MQPEGVKKILRYYQEIAEMVKLLKREEEELEEEYNGLKGVGLDGMPHGISLGRPTEFSVERIVGKSIGNRLGEIRIKTQVLESDAAIIRACLDLLNGKYKRVLSMRYRNGYSWAKISVRLHIPESTVRNWHDRALKRLGEAQEEVPMVDEIMARASCAR